MQVFAIKNKDGMKINADVNVKNCKECKEFLIDKKNR